MSKRDWQVIEELPITAPAAPPAIAGLDVLDHFIADASDRARHVFGLRTFNQLKTDYSREEVIATVNIEDCLSLRDVIRGLKWSDEHWFWFAEPGDWVCAKERTEQRLIETFGALTPEDITLTLVDELDKKLVPPWLEFVITKSERDAHPELRLTKAGRQKAFLRLLRQRHEAGFDVYGVPIGFDSFGKRLAATAA